MSTTTPLVSATPPTDYQRYGAIEVKIKNENKESSTCYSHVYKGTLYTCNKARMLSGVIWLTTIIASATLYHMNQYVWGQALMLWGSNASACAYHFGKRITCEDKWITLIGAIAMLSSSILSLQISTSYSDPVQNPLISQLSTPILFVGQTVGTLMIYTRTNFITNCWCDNERYWGPPILEPED